MAQFIGRDIGGHRIIEPIGVGGMAQVFKAYQPSFDRFVALKILPELLAADADYIERFHREARIIARLEHRHILPVYDFGEDNGTAYLTMRYLRGGTLKDVLERVQGILPLEDTVRIISQLASALDYAHSQGIIHRDVKPSNVLVDRDGDLYLMDFGIAKVIEGTSQLTKTGGAIGTPAYMSPEQGLGQQVDHRTDIYALGVILYQMMTGNVPFEADTPLAVILAHVNNPLPLPSERNPGIPADIENVIFTALAKDPQHRYASAGELATAFASATRQDRDLTIPVSGQLLDISSDLADTLPSDEITDDVRRRAKRKPRDRRFSPFLIGGIAVAVVAAVGITAVLLSRSSRQVAEISGTATMQAFSAASTAAALAGATIDPTQAYLVVGQATETAEAARVQPTLTAQANSNATATQRALLLTLTPYTRTPAPTTTPVMTSTPRPTATTEAWALGGALAERVLPVIEDTAPFFSDTFSNPDSGWVNNFLTYSPSKGSGEYIGGRYRITTLPPVDDPSHEVIIRNDTLRYVRDYVLSIDMLFSGESYCSSCEFSINCEYILDDDVKLYRITMQRSGSFFLHRTGTPDQISPWQVESDTVMTFQVISLGRELAVLLDGIPVLYDNNQAFQNTCQFSLAAHNASIGALIVEIDNFRFWNLAGVTVP